MQNKYIDVGLHCLMNEEKNVRGWAKLMLFYCKKVYAIIDPTTSDKTEEILRNDFPEINILYQDRSMGDSDYDIEGPQKSLIMHNNLTYFMNVLVQPDEWVMFLAADERFHPDHLFPIKFAIKVAQETKRDGIITSKMYEFYTKDDYVDFERIGPTAQVKFFKKPKTWLLNPQPHSNRSFFPQNGLKLDYPMYHYPNHRMNNKITNCWVYQGNNNSYTKLIHRFGMIPTKKCPRLIQNWADYPYLDNNGELNGV